MQPHSRLPKPVLPSIPQSLRPSLVGLHITVRWPNELPDGQEPASVLLDRRKRLLESDLQPRTTSPELVWPDQSLAPSQPPDPNIAAPIDLRLLPSAKPRKASANKVEAAPRVPLRRRRNPMPGSTLAPEDRPRPNSLPDDSL